MKVPEHNVLGTSGSGMELMGQRLGIGRLLRSMNWVGLAQRCFDLMGARINSERGRTARLPEKQLVRQHVVNAYQAIASARELIRVAARGSMPSVQAMWKSISQKWPRHRPCALRRTRQCSFMALKVSAISLLLPVFIESRGHRGSSMAQTSRSISSAGRRLINFFKEQDTYHFA